MWGVPREDESLPEVASVTSLQLKMKDRGVWHVFGVVMEKG